MKKQKIQRMNNSFEVKNSEDKILCGYAVRYNEPAPLYGDINEQVMPGSFGETVEGDIRCLFNHNHDIVLGRSTANTLKLFERPEGLYFELEINENDSEALNIYERVKRGDITGCSFGAYVNSEEYDYDNKLVTLKELELIEISVCPFPFYSTTSVNARDVEGAGLEIIKDHLRKEFLKRRLKNGAKRLND